jgi:hypothetical protein
VLPTPTRPSDEDSDTRAFELRLATLISPRQPEDVSTPLAPQVGTDFSTNLLPTHPSNDDNEIRALDLRLTALLSQLQPEHVSAPLSPHPTLSPGPASLASDATIHHPAHADMNTDFSNDLLPGPGHPFSIAAAAQSTHDDTTRAQDDTARAQAFAFAQRKLDALIAATLAEEAVYKAQQDDKTVVVRNLAADAEEDDVRTVFGVWEREIVDVAFLRERDGVRRTRTARVEMWKREDAVGAVREVAGNVFGLDFKVELAVPEESEGDDGGEEDEGKEDEEKEDEEKEDEEKDEEKEEGERGSGEV